MNQNSERLLLLELTKLIKEAEELFITSRAQEKKEEKTRGNLRKPGKE